MFDDGDSPAELAPDQRQRAWLASILLQSQRSWFGRFTLHLRALAALRRGQRKRLERKAAVTLAGAALALSLGIGMMRAPAVHAASITVDNGVIIVANDGDCSLLEAILNANSDSQVYAAAGECAPGSGADTINLPAAGLFTLTATYNMPYASETGLPPVTTEMTIEGNGAIIERDTSVGNFRIMAVSATGDLTLNDVTLRNGHSDDDGGALHVAGYALVTGSTFTANYADSDGGGASAGVGGTLILDDTLVDYNISADEGGGVTVEAYATLTVRNGSEISNNYALNAGGGIIAKYQNIVTIDASTIGVNVAGSDGGGMFTNQATVYIQNGAAITDNDAGSAGGGGAFYLSDVTITDSTVNGNSAYQAGGGLAFTGSTATITGSTIDDNHLDPGQPYAQLGGGVFIVGIFPGVGDPYPSTVTISDSTVSGNSAGHGGGIFNYPGNWLYVNHSTISGNEATIGGGLMNFTGMFQLINTTVSGNKAVPYGTAIGYGGGIASLGPVSGDPYQAMILLSTITGNSAGEGGGIIVGDGNHYLVASIVSGNDAAGNANEISDNYGIVSLYNLLGDDSQTNAQAFDGFAGGPNLTATSDGYQPTALADILNTTLANNGGPTFTHALVPYSPAVDILPSILCAPATPIGDLDDDQRHEPRPINIPGMGDNTGSNLCDIGAYEMQLETVGFCPVDPAVGNLRTSALGIGQGSPTKGYRTRKLVVPNLSELDSLYGQLAAVDVGLMKYVRFLPQGYPKIQIYPPTSAAYRQHAVSWWGTDLPTDASYVKGQFFWGARGNKSPRAFVLWPTYTTTDEYANVFTTFDDSTTNHVAWETGFIPTQTQTIAIPETQAAGATVNATVALVDVNKDNRPVLVTVEAGGVSEGRYITQPNKGLTLNLEEFTLEDVDAGADEVTITLESPFPSVDFPNGGDSAAMIGAAVNYQCEPETPPPAPRPDVPAQSGFWSGMMARLQQARAAQPAQSERAGNGRFGNGWAQQGDNR